MVPVMLRSLSELAQADVALGQLHEHSAAHSSLTSSVVCCLCWHQNKGVRTAHACTALPKQARLFGARMLGQIHLCRQVRVCSWCKLAYVETSQLLGSQLSCTCVACNCMFYDL